MTKIQIINGDLSLFKNFEIVESKSKLIFFDWYDLSHRHKFTIQIEKLKESIKDKMKIFIFDRFLSLTNEEINYFQKNDIILLEPAINYRRNFKYLPFPIDQNEPKLNKEKRNDFLAYNGNLKNKIKQFKKYYISYLEIFENKLYIKEIEDEIKIEFSKFNIENKEDNNIKCEVLLCSNLEGNIGYLDHRLNNLLNNNIIPLIPKEHRFFQIFETTISNYKNFDFFMKLYDGSYYGWIKKFKEDIKTYFPEMLKENVIKNLEEIINE